MEHNSEDKSLLYIYSYVFLNIPSIVGCVYVGVRGAWPWAQCVITVGKFEPTEVPVVTYEEEEEDIQGHRRKVPSDSHSGICFNSSLRDTEYS